MLTLPLALLALQTGGASVLVNVTVNSSKVFGRIAEDSLGLGTAVWDDHLNDPAVPSLIHSAGFEVLRYPGGSYSDLFHWQTYKPTDGLNDGFRAGDDFDNFMKVVRRSHTTPLITINYGSNQAGTGGGIPEEAAAWVRYANRVKHYGVRYWEIGNEVYGNGFYNGHPWELDDHLLGRENRQGNPALSPDAYGRNVTAFAEGMKTVDPSIKVGAVLCMPKNWPEGIEPDWNEHVLAKCGQAIDFVVVHWYGDSHSPDTILGSPSALPAELAILHHQLESYGSLKIWMTEGDADGFDMKPEGALFAADELFTFWENGVDHVDWWDLHNGAHRIAGGVDDQGILSNGSSAADVEEPPPNTPFPPYYAIKLVREISDPGDELIAVGSDDPQVKVHAVKHHGAVGLVVINEHKDTAIRVQIDCAGADPIITRSLTYDPAAQPFRISVGHPETSSLQLPPYSLVGLDLSSTARPQRIESVNRREP